MRELTITRPDDWHLHLRDGKPMADVVHHSAAHFARAIVMPNLRPPITTTAMAVDYRRRILCALPEGSRFEPLMTLYLTDLSDPREIQKAVHSGVVAAVKLYPAGATTNSDEGVTDMVRVGRVLGAMEEKGLPLLVHGEVTDPEVDFFDREKVFIERVLAPMVESHQGLKVVFEHVTTADAVDFVLAARPGVVASITPHHLMLSRNAIFAGGLQPHHYCLPVLKRERHRQALVRAVAGGSPRFFLGTDSAPHPRTAKEAPCGCAGVFNAHAALAVYAEVLEEAGALDRLEAFACFHGPDHYGLPRNQDRLTLVKEPWTVPMTYPFGDDDLVPLAAGETLSWQVAE